MGLSVSKHSRNTETTQSCRASPKPSTRFCEDKVSATQTDTDSDNEEESFYSWFVIAEETDKGPNSEKQPVGTLTCEDPIQGEEFDSSSLASTVDMGDQKNTVNDLGAQLKEQLHVEEEAWHGNQSEPKGPETLTPAESRANQSSGTQGTSRGGSDGNQQIVRMSTGTSSARSSFALDQADILANRKSLEAFHKAYCHQEDHGLRFKRSDTNTSGDGHDLNDVDFFTKYAHDVEVLVGLGLPRELCKEAWMLSVLPSECPAPVSMLSKLWNIQESAAESCMLSLAELGVLKVAHLPDGNIWGLPQDNFIRQVQNQAHNENCQVLFHKSLVVGYARDAWFHARKSGPAPSSLITDDAMLFSLFACDLLDDGYIITNLVYHLVGARLDTVVRALLLSPEWLEKKLLSSGAAPVISDFRRYLMMYRDEDVKSVLEADRKSVV